MITYRNLLQKTAALPHLERAFRRAFRGKGRRPEAAMYAFTKEQRLSKLQRQLLSGAFGFKGYRRKFLLTPKPRLIAAAPFGDRVVHHAIYQTLDPIFGPGFIDQLYACLKHRGTHRAVLEFQRMMTRYRFLVRLDIVKYFPSIRWDDVKNIVARRVNDERFMDLLEKLLVSAANLYSDPKVIRFMGISPAPDPGSRVGLPIGNLTSQFFGNLVLSEFDHFCKRQLKIPGYIRYMDDIAFFGNHRPQVREWIAAANEWLWEHRRLQLHSNTAVQHCASSRLVYLGYYVDATERHLRGRTLRRMRDNVRTRVNEGSAEALETLERSLVSYGGLVLI